MKNSKFLIVLAYYNRPKMVRTALKSIQELDYQNFHVTGIDDGSKDHLAPIMIEMLGDKVSWSCYYIDDSPQQKIAQGGSRHGEYLNKAILESDSDLVVILCDDDALISDSLTKLNKWFDGNPDKKYAYSHVRTFNSDIESPFDVKEKRDHWTNRNDDLNPFCAVDSTQVVYKTSCFKEDGLRYPFPQTKDLDAAIFKQLFKKYGLCSFTGIDIQYKNYFSNQLGKNNPNNQFLAANIE